MKTSNKKLVKAQHPKTKAFRCRDEWRIYDRDIQSVIGRGKTAAQAWHDAALRAISARSSKGIRAFIDRLIAWSNPQAPIRVHATANTVRKFARKRDGVFKYRNRVIVPIRPVRTRVEIAAERSARDHQSI